jgi:hypothetical protein
VAVEQMENAQSTVRIHLWDLCFKGLKTNDSNNKYFEIAGVDFVSFKKMALKTSMRT